MAPDHPARAVRHRWREYTTASGSNPLREFLAGLTRADRSAVLAEMAAVQRDGVLAARHLRGDIYEVRAKGDGSIYRVLFAREGRRGQVLLALSAFQKKTQRTPRREIELAGRRLTDWRARGDGGR
ncbi:MAG TPA: type II toxin-antitoxin system RelE/ParE family toxin [Baekduia sp.]